MKIYRFLMISFLLSGLSAFAAQEEFDLNVKDLKECFALENAQRHIDVVKNLSLMPELEIEQLFYENVAAKEFVPKLQQVAKQQPKKWFSIYFTNHVAFLFAEKKLEKSFIDESYKSSSNIFLTMGSCVTKQKFSKRKKQENEIDNYIKLVKYDEDNLEINRGFTQYSDGFVDEMQKKEIKSIAVGCQINSMIYALALQYQKVHNIFNEHKDVLHENIQKKDFEKRAIVNGKRVAAVGFGIFTGFVAMTAWLWSWQA